MNSYRESTLNLQIGVICNIVNNYLILFVVLAAVLEQQAGNIVCDFYIGGNVAAIVYNYCGEEGSRMDYVSQLRLRIRACARVISLASVLWPRHTSPKCAVAKGLFRAGIQVGVVTLAKRSRL